MEALRSAGRAIIRSPSAAKQSWGSGKHKKLPENWTDTRETLLEGMLFNLKYMGMTLVEQPKGEDLSAAAVRRIVAMAKARGKKLQKVTLKVSPRGIILNDSGTNELIENVSIYRISYCTADKSHDKVFAYIAQSQHNENLECHAFLCPKRKLAQAVTLTVAQAFKVAFEFWQASKEEKEKREKSISEGEGASGPNSEDPAGLKASVATGNLLDFEDAAKSPLPVSTNATHVDELGPNFSSENNNIVWEMDDGLEEAFSRSISLQAVGRMLKYEAAYSSIDVGSIEAINTFLVDKGDQLIFLFRLAQSRTNPHVLDTGLTAQDIQSAETLSPVDWDKIDSNAAEKDDLFGF
ncbi:Low density lipoprotein receptor adapter protein 1 [Platysternon megacephalum]|uniref:Low density lipoprotein receptor adapter protein 1 n=1 Tax=Platysternon megacephalum TaxID=55544 RepID=A0A4D9ESB5_9SAUR|nr:Low density lipoprotein receptor adapter protein 1 [Platysternon megacephalum]